MPNKVMRPVDKTKLEKLLLDRGFSMSAASVEIGYSSGGFSSLRKRGTLSDTILIGLKHRFNITYDEIKPDEPKDEPKAEQMTIEKPKAESSDTAIDWAKFEWHIRRAVAAALQDRGL